MSSEGGRFKRAFQRLSASNEDLEASDIRKVCDGHRMARISDVHDREYVKVGGTVKQVALAPRAGTPTLEATLYDGTGSVTVVFLGRRRMAGVDPECRWRSSAGSASATVSASCSTRAMSSGSDAAETDRVSVEALVRRTSVRRARWQAGDARGRPPDRRVHHHLGGEPSPQAVAGHLARARGGLPGRPGRAAFDRPVRSQCARCDRHRGGLRAPVRAGRGRVPARAHLQQRLRGRAVALERWSDGRWSGSSSAV